MRFGGHRRGEGRITINVDRLPVDIRTSRRALVWNYKMRQGKLTKVPYMARRPADRAAVNDPSTWAPFLVAIKTYEDGDVDGVGIVLGTTGDQTLTGIDIDRCRDPESGRITPDAQAIIDEVNSYTEISPSGTGVHLLVYGDLPPGRRRTGGVEMYAAGRYFTVTSHHLTGTPITIEQRVPQLVALHARIFGGHGQATPAAPPLGAACGLNDAALLARAQAAQNGALFSKLWTGDTSGYDSPSEADQALCNLLAFWTRADPARMDQLFCASGLWREKWNERRGEATYGQRTIATALAGCREVYRRPGRSEVRSPRAETSEGPVPTPEARADDTGLPTPVTLKDFYGYMPMHTYIFAPSRDHWPAASVNARVPPVALVDTTGEPVRDEDGKPKVMKAAAWIDRHQPVEQLTWIPGHPMLIRDRLVSEGGWIERRGCTTFNLYRPPSRHPGDPEHAGRWLDHLRAIYPDDADHIVAWLAHRVQRPADKINHALVLGGLQGIGKDTMLEPIKAAIGPWNFIEVSPAHLLGRFNGFVKSVILRTSETRDLGDVNRFAFYDHLKAYTAQPPDVLRVDEKHVREYAVWNVTGVVMTTNHRTDGLYLPADDRRHYVAWSARTKADFTAEYWTTLYRWYANGGTGHVAAYLAAYDLARFNAKAPPPQTPAFFALVDANRSPEDAELADALDQLNHPAALTLADLAGPVPSEFAAWLQDRKYARLIPHRLETVGYVAVRNPAAKDGHWKIDGRRRAVYARQDLPLRDQIRAAGALTAAGAMGGDR